MNNKLSVALAFATLASNAAPLYAHSGEVHASREYPPTTNEFGSYDPSFEPGRTIEVTMHDTMVFDPASIEVRAGEVVRFRITNAGALMHEFVIGTEGSLSEHAELMKKFPAMEHDEPYMAHVPPGETMVIIWKFDKVGKFGVACLLPGHYEAGMKGDLIVN